MLRPIHINMVGHELPIILVGRHHIDIETLGGGLPGDGTNHIVGFIMRNFEDRDVISPDNLPDDRDRLADDIRRLLPLSFVLFESLVAERRPWRIEGDGDMRRIFSFQHIFEDVYKPENCRCINPFGIDARGT